MSTPASKLRYAVLKGRHVVGYVESRSLSWARVMARREFGPFFDVAEVKPGQRDGGKL